MTAFCYVLSSLSKEKRVPMQGRTSELLFAGELDFNGIEGFGEALARAEHTQIHSLALQSQGLQVVKQSSQRVPSFVWNDADRRPADDRADLVLRLCISATEATLRIDHPKDGAIASATAQLLEKLCHTK
jgi:hypothetical protein